MNSIPAALTWELFDRGRWSLPAAALGALAFPIILLSALAHEGALDPNHGSMLIMHLVLVQFNALIFGSILIGLQWKVSPLYAYPASNATLSTWRLLPAMIAMAGETVVWTVALNAIFHLDWPLWGPALFSAVAVASVVSTCWLMNGSRWVILAFTIVGVGLGLWFSSRYGGMFSQPTRQWSVLTPTEVFTMAGCAALAWRAAVVGVASNRRGEPPFSLGLVAWIDRLLDRAPPEQRPFRTAAHAQFSYHWRHGLFPSMFIITVMLVGLVVWLVASLDPRDLVYGVFVGAAILPCAALVTGAVLGDLSPTKDLVIGQFLATRPMTPAEQARIILRVGAASMLLGWVVWAAALAVAYGVAAALGGSSPDIVPPDQDWRLVPVAFVGSWIVVAVLISALLTGRSLLFVRLIIVAFAAYIGFVLLAKFALSAEAFQWSMHALASAFGVALVLGAIWAFVAARRRGLVDASTAWAALAAWAVLVIVAVLALPHGVEIPRTGYVLLVGFAALAVAPLAGAPLALAWNRHR